MRHEAFAGPVDARTLSRTSATYWRDLISLTKPGIVALVLATALAGMWVAVPTWPSLALIAATLGGTALASAAGAVFNNVYDADIDECMQRTKARPTVTGRVSRVDGIAFGTVLTVLSFIVLALGANLLAACLGLAGIFSYAVVYTMVLKRRTALCTEFGGIAGAIPPMIGWAAVTGSLSVGAWVLFAIMFVWQPPHFWALAAVKRDEYARAGVPMLPVAWGVPATQRRTLLYALLLMPVTLLPVLIGLSGPLYLGAALVLNLGFVGLAARFALMPLSVRRARQLFFYSILYLFCLQLALVFDVPGAL